MSSGSCRGPGVRPVIRRPTPRAARRRHVGGLWEMDGRGDRRRALLRQLVDVCVHVDDHTTASAGVGTRDDRRPRGRLDHGPPDWHPSGYRPDRRAASDDVPGPPPPSGDRGRRSLPRSGRGIRAGPLPRPGARPALLGLAARRSARPPCRAHSLDRPAIRRGPADVRRRLGRRSRHGRQRLARNRHRDRRPPVARPARGGPPEPRREQRLWKVEIAMHRDCGPSRRRRRSPDATEVPHVTQPLCRSLPAIGNMIR